MRVFARHKEMHKPRTGCNQAKKNMCDDKVERVLGCNVCIGLSLHMNKMVLDELLSGQFLPYSISFLRTEGLQFYSQAFRFDTCRLLKAQF